MSKVYQAIAAVQGELAKSGIAKNRKNKQGEGYMFRGIDDVYAALSPLLAAHGLCIIPRVIHREMVERQSARGNPLFYVTVRAEFDFVSSEDGSVHTAATFGEAMDSGDKATNKAMSAAYKYAAFMTFAIPTEGDNDADAHTPDVAAKSASPSAQAVTDAINLIGAAATLPALQDQWLALGVAMRRVPEVEAAKDARKAKLEAPQRDDVLADEIPY